MINVFIHLNAYATGDYVKLIDAKLLMQLASREQMVGQEIEIDFVGRMLPLEWPHAVWHWTPGGITFFVLVQA